VEREFEKVGGGKQESPHTGDAIFYTIGNLCVQIQCHTANHPRTEHRGK
jgi:hypothetical protein